MRILYRVINCDRHTGRYASFRSAADDAGLGRIVRVPCKDASAWGTTHLCRMATRGVFDGDMSDLTRAEVAINLSHRVCWEQFVRSRAEFLCVFEDDVTPGSGFDSLLRCLVSGIMQQDGRLDVLHILNGNWGRTLTSTKRHITVTCDLDGATERLVVNREVGHDYIASASCYVLGREFAEVLLQHQFPIHSPVDNYVGELDRSSFRHLVLKTDRDEHGCWTRNRMGTVLCPIEDSAYTTHQTSDAAAYAPLCAGQKKIKRHRRSRSKRAT